MEANKNHLKEMIETLYSISEPCEAGVQRQSYSKAYRRGVDYIRQKMDEIGLITKEDQVGNVFGTLEGRESYMPCLMSGSHLDTVRCAGAFDGIAGVVCAIEAARMVKESGQPLRHPFTVVGTIGEEGIDIGIVKAIAGIAWLEITVTGEANHRGTVPMDQRKDAGISAYTMILELNQYITEHFCGRATMTAGQLNLSPGSSNCIPGKCVFTLDIRSGDGDILKNILKKVDFCAREQEKAGMEVETKTLSYREPVLMDEKLQSEIEKSCQKLNLSYRYLDSGAGHEVTPEFYLSCYDMGRSDFFTSEDIVSKDQVEQNFTDCVFANTWMKDHDEKYGIHYCEMIDPAIAEGYDENFECIHDKHFFKDGCCHFLFKKKED